MLIGIFAGGTGGHIFPALAVAKELMKLNHEIIWLGAINSMEKKIVSQNNIEIELINISGLRRKGVLSWISAPFKIIIAIKQSMKILKNHRPNVVLGMGGFVSGPGSIAAKLMGIPLVIHEQNAIAGLTNKILRPFANKVLQAFPNTLSNAITVGNPVRENLFSIEQKKITLPLNVLILGGSLGAQIFNETMPEVLARFKGEINLWHQTGANKFVLTEQKYQLTKKYKSVKLVEFINDINEALAWADVVICRAGAMTIFEIAAAGRAALFVPYPYAVDDHQTHNARFLTQHKAALQINQTKFNASYLVQMLNIWTKTPQILDKMASKAKLCQISESSKRVAKICVEQCS